MTDRGNDSRVATAYSIINDRSKTKHEIQNDGRRDLWKYSRMV